MTLKQREVKFDSEGVGNGSVVVNGKNDVVGEAVEEVVSGVVEVAVEVVVVFGSQIQRGQLMKYRVSKSQPKSLHGIWQVDRFVGR